ncbi:MAG: hypothetical protein D3903_14500 [Candidatus Electrothrix sp. GM3_4]|nr:hypothetical protein [Candidatus Electrothrix sp. GM3_4]
MGSENWLKYFFRYATKKNIIYYLRRDTRNGSEEDIVFYLLYSFLYCYFFWGMVFLNYAKVSVAADSR